MSEEYGDVEEHETVADANGGYVGFTLALNFISDRTLGTKGGSTRHNSRVSRIEALSNKGSPLKSTQLQCTFPCSSSCIEGTPFPTSQPFCSLPRRRDC